MRIFIGYPPLKLAKGVALLSQNRQFQWFSNPSYLFPVILGSAATLLKSKGYEVSWIDCIAENISMEEFFRRIEREKPNLFVFETKTPVIKQHWKIINELKEKFPEMKIAILGDHVTALPEESMKNSKVDFVICGGDFDFSLLNLCNWISGKEKKLDKGIYYRKGKKIVNSGEFCLKHSLDELPFIDRQLTKWRLYEKEYNLQGKPFFYIMSGRDCWWGKCKFCAWPMLFPSFRVRSVENVLDEIGMLIQRYNVKEIFDDSGTLMTGVWLKELCNGLIERGYNKKISYSCNMRFNALSQEDFDLMKKAGFRLLKFGLESANQKTLDKLNKGIKVQDIIDGCRMAKKAGLTVHLTMIVGYPWENKGDAMRTFRLAKQLMQNGKADLLQATILVPYPGTPLWKEGRENFLFLFPPEQYERYDMREPILRTENSNANEIAAICGKIYTIFLTPSYIFQRTKNIKSWSDLMFNFKGLKAVFGHLKDFFAKKRAVTQKERVVIQKVFNQKFVFTEINENRKMKLNLGCGTDIREGYLNLDVEPFDVLKKKAKELQGRDIRNDEYKQYNLDKYPYPFKDNSIDEILAFGVIEHIKDYKKCVEELKRILKAGGTLHIKVPHFTCAGSNSEFHKTRFWYHSFTPYRVRKSQRTSGEASGLYSNLEQVGKKKINFVKGFLFWNYLIEPIINLHPLICILYEHTLLCYLFPASEIEVRLRKVN